MNTIPEKNSHEDLQARLQILVRSEVLKDYPNIVRTLNALEANTLKQPDLALEILQQIQAIQDTLLREIDTLNNKHTIEDIRTLKEMEGHTNLEAEIEKAIKPAIYEQYTKLNTQIRSLQEITAVQYIAAYAASDVSNDDDSTLSGDVAKSNEDVA